MDLSLSRVALDHPHGDFIRAVGPVEQNWVNVEGHSAFQTAYHGESTVQSGYFVFKVAKGIALRAWKVRMLNPIPKQGARKRRIWEPWGRHSCLP